MRGYDITYKRCPNLCYGNLREQLMQSIQGKREKPLMVKMTNDGEFVSDIVSFLKGADRLSEKIIGGKEFDGVMMDGFKATICGRNSEFMIFTIKRGFTYVVDSKDNTFVCMVCMTKNEQEHVLYLP